MNGLDPRKQTILQAVILEYVSGAEPVASEQLVQKYELGVKSATVRNEMAELSELGYLEQPHTSAGRIPSDLGYRYYVDRLIVSQEVEPLSKNRVRDVAEDGETLQNLLRETTKVLSRLTQLLSVATTVRHADVVVRNAVFSAMGPSQALLVLVLSNGHIENRMIECPPGLTLEDVGQINESLISSIAGKSLRALSKAKSPTGGNPTADKLIATVWSGIKNIAKETTRGAIITEGEEFMYAQPEFRRDLHSLNEMLADLIDSDVLYEAMVPGDQPQVVTIGRENRNQKMHQLSVVRHSFYVGENEAGVIALVGPTRMKYDSSIPLVDFTAKALSESLTRFFG